MMLRFFQRGEPITADKLNDIVSAVRANEVAPGVGYAVFKTPAGTTLSITPGASGGGGGGGGTAAPCPFGATKKVMAGFQFVEIAQNTVATPNARWPIGMGPGYSPYVIAITETTYIYVQISYLPNEVIVRPEDSAISILPSPELMENSVDLEYVLVAIVAFEDGEITEITNTCANVTANPCNLKWS